MKQLWLLVGGNGAGKSTFYRLVLEPLGLPPSLCIQMLQKSTAMKRPC